MYIGAPFAYGALRSHPHRRNACMVTGLAISVVSLVGGFYREYYFAIDRHARSSLRYWGANQLLPGVFLSGRMVRRQERIGLWGCHCRWRCGRYCRPSDNGMDPTELGIPDRATDVDCRQFCVDDIGALAIETSRTNPTYRETLARLIF